MKRILIFIVFLVIVAVFTYFVMPNLSFFNGATEYLRSIPVQLQNGWAWLQSYGVTPAQLLGAVGGIATISTLIIAKLRSSLSNTKQQAQAQLQQTQAYAVQQQNVLSTQATSLQGMVDAQKQQIATLQQQLYTASAGTQDLTLWKSNYEKLQNDYNVMEQTYQNLINDLKQKTQVVYQ